MRPLVSPSDGARAAQRAVRNIPAPEAFGMNYACRPRGETVQCSAPFLSFIR
jgi:hypothetical protein